MRWGALPLGRSLRWDAGAEYYIPVQWFGAVPAAAGCYSAGAWHARNKREEEGSEAMDAALGTSARYARPILLIGAGLLAGGALLTVLGLPIVGWPTYALGHLGLLLAVPALGAAYRHSLPAVAWAWLAAAFVGFLLGLAGVLTILGHYLANQHLQVVVLAREVMPLGTWPNVVGWLGLALFAIVGFAARDVPRGGAVTLLVAALLIAATELGLLEAYIWALSVVLAGFGLVWLAPLAPEETSA